MRSSFLAWMCERLYVHVCVRASLCACRHKQTTVVVKCASLTLAGTGGKERGREGGGSELEGYL